MSIFDSGFIFSPALRIAHGFKLSDIYFQYDLLLSLIALAGIKLNMVFSFIQYAVQLALYALLFGMLLFSHRLFYKKGIAVLLLAFVVIVRLYSNSFDMMCFLQTSPVRLDLWFILLVMVYWKNPYHWSVGLAYALMVILHRNFGYIYLAAYVQLLFILFLTDIAKQSSSGSLFVSSWLSMKVNFARSRINLLIIISGIIISGVLFGSYIPSIVKDYGALGLGMLPVAADSFYWYIIFLLTALAAVLLIYRNYLSDQYFIIGIFTVLLSFGNLIYFTGRSHENNLLNISAIAGFALFLFFDIMIFVNGLFNSGHKIKTRIKAALLFSMPFIAVLGAAYSYGQRIDAAIKGQYAAMLNCQTLVPMCYAHDDFVTVKELTNNSRKVYFLDAGGDFPSYYFGNYIPPGYLNPCGAFIIRANLAAFVQKLLDDHYCIVTRDFETWDDISTLVTYNSVKEKNGYLVAEKTETKFIFKHDTAGVLHLVFPGPLNVKAVKYHPVKLDSRFAIRCILKPDSQQQPFAEVIDNRHSTIGNRGFCITQAEGMNNTFEFIYGDNSHWIKGPPFKLTAGQWNLLTIAMTDNTLKISINGVMLPPVAGLNALKNSPLPLLIGNCIQDGRPFKGHIRELKITNYNAPDEMMEEPDSLILKKAASPYFQSQ